MHHMETRLVWGNLLAERFWYMPSRFLSVVLMREAQRWPTRQVVEVRYRRDVGKPVRQQAVKVSIPLNGIVKSEERNKSNDITINSGNEAATTAPKTAGAATLRSSTAINTTTTCNDRLSLTSITAARYTALPLPTRLASFACDGAAHGIFFTSCSSGRRLTQVLEAL